MKYKLVCLTDQRTITTNTDLEEIQRRYRVHRRRTGHSLEIYPMSLNANPTGKEIIESPNYVAIKTITDEEE